MTTENTKLDYNLQLFADGEGTGDASDTKADAKAESNEPQDKGDKSPKGKEKDESKGSSDIDIQKMMTDYAKLKRAFDKTSSELADTKKALKERLTEQEIASQEKAEAEAKREEEFEYYKRKDKIHETEKAYLKLGYTADEAERIAVAEADNDFETRSQIMGEVMARQKKEMEAEFIANRPEINAGSGSDVLTKEKFDHMDMVERTKLRRNDPETYEKFIGRK